MANEAVLKLRLDHPINFTVADGTGIEKGTVMKLTDSKTASASSANGDIFAGIAAREKVANNGVTSLALFRRGIFDMVDSGAGTTAGMWVKIAGTNTIAVANEAEVADGKGIGIALETASAGETIEILVGGY